MTRTEARMIAQELHRLMQGDIRAAAAEAAARATDGWLSSTEAAALLGWSVKTLYNRILDVPHTKVGKHLRFTRSSLERFIRDGAA